MSTTTDDTGSRAVGDVGEGRATEPHAYQRACRNTQHAGCTCMYPIDGRWCGRPRYDPIHLAADAPADDRRAGGDR